MSSRSRTRLHHSAYTVALICPMEVEMSAARYMLDEEHETLSKNKNDKNYYILGRLSRHNVIIASLPEGSQGSSSATTVATHLARTFPAIELRLSVGIGGGVPSKGSDVRLGDVVVSAPSGTSSGVIQYDMGKQTPTGFERKGFLSPSPTEWRSAMTVMKSDHRVKQNRINEFILGILQKSPQLAEYQRPPPEKDILFQADYQHDQMETTCTNCDKSRAINREQRAIPDLPLVFYGLIASGNRLIKNAKERDLISKDSDGALCFETNAAGLMNDFGCIAIRGIADYCDSHKSDEWHAYAAAAAAGLAKEILLYMDPIDTADPLGYSRDDRIQSTLRIEKLEFLRQLYVLPYRNFKDRNPKRVNDTCEWFTNHPLFQSWNESITSSLLWVSADPGCGKSVLAKYLVDFVLLSTKSRTVCYFFFKDDFDNQRSMACALSCVLHQLFLQKELLLSDDVLIKLQVFGEKLAQSFVDLWDILISAVRGNDGGEIICILDGLDECEDKERWQLIDALTCFHETKSILKFLITSRPNVAIQREFRRLNSCFPIIRLSGEDEVEVEKISQEINIFIESRVTDIGENLQLLPEEQQLLLGEMLRAPNRTYLWVHLTLEVIQSSVNITKDSILTDTSKIPKTVDEAYNKILNRSHDFEKARRLLQIVVASTRPLSLKEMALALAIKETRQSYADLELEPEGRFRNTIRDVCGLFVTIIDSKIYLLHQSAKEFLVRKFSADLTSAPNSDSHLKWKSSLWPGDSNRILAEICIWYLFSKELQIDPSDANRASNIHIDDHVFLDYSAKSWASHFQKAHITNDVAITTLAMKLCNICSQSGLTWFRVYWTLTDSDYPEDFRDHRYGRSAISWAAENGHEAVLKLLLNQRAKVNFKGITKLKLKKGAKVDSKDKNSRTPLSYAAANGHEKIARLLLEKGVELEIRDRNGRTPLSYAAEGGHEAAVKLLLERGAELETKSNSGQTPLSYAADNGHETVVKLLQETSAKNAEI